MRGFAPCPSPAAATSRCRRRCVRLCRRKHCFLRSMHKCSSPAATLARLPILIFNQRCHSLSFGPDDVTGLEVLVGTVSVAGTAATKVYETVVS